MILVTCHRWRIIPSLSSASFSSFNYVQRYKHIHYLRMCWSKMAVVYNVNHYCVPCVQRNLSISATACTAMDGWRMSLAILKIRVVMCLEAGHFPVKHGRGWSRGNYVDFSIYCVSLKKNQDLSPISEVPWLFHNWKLAHNSCHNDYFLKVFPWKMCAWYVLGGFSHWDKGGLCWTDKMSMYINYMCVGLSACMQWMCTCSLKYITPAVDQGLFCASELQYW